MANNANCRKKIQKLLDFYVMLNCLTVTPWSLILIFAFIEYITVWFYDNFWFRKQRKHLKQITIYNMVREPAFKSSQFGQYTSTQGRWCLSFMSTWSHSSFIKEFVDSKPLFLLFSYYLLVCFTFVLSLWTMHFWSLTSVFYTGLTYVEWLNKRNDTCIKRSTK